MILKVLSKNTFSEKILLRFFYMPSIYIGVVVIWKLFTVCLLRYVLESLLTSTLADKKKFFINGKFKNKYEQNPDRIIIYEKYRKLFFLTIYNLFKFLSPTTGKLIERIVFFGFLSAFK